MLGMEDEDTTISEQEEVGILDILNEITHTDRSFFSTLRFLDGHTRNHIVAAHLRNTTAMLNIINRYMTEPHRTVINIPISNTAWLDPVPIVPSAAQITAATETNIQMTDTTCSICQESVEQGTRIRSCGHSFHSQCIQQWFQQNPRCPMCRHDIRDLQPSVVENNNEGSRVHTNEE